MVDSAVPPDTVVGQKLGHYRFIEKLGAGGMGDVYRAHDEHLDREVAIKVLPFGTLSDESSRKRFHKEALVLSKLNHPNIATIYDFDTQADVDFLVMEYIPGLTLSEKLAERPLPDNEVIALGTQLAEGLCAAHEHGVVHRDLKPGNLRVTGDGRLKILDFGLAKLRLPVMATAVTESLTEGQGISGTLPYMAPEQLLGGDIDARSDIWGAGCVLYEMVTGRRPFPGSGTALTDAILHSVPAAPLALNPRLSAGLNAVIGKCLEKDPNNRYQSSKELVIDLRRLSTPSPITPFRAPTPKRLPKIAKAALAGAAALVLVLVIAWNVGRWHERVLQQSGGPQIKSLAVLPLANFSRDPEQDYFADGMTEALITEIAKGTELRVISRTSVMHYKGAQKPLPEIARELNVDAVVEGSVQRSGGRVRITAQLIRGASDQHLWAESYERDLRDVLELQDEVARAIAQQVKSKLRSENATPPRLVKPEAYEAYLKGLYYWNKRTPESLRKSAEYFQEAIAKDPGYAPAYASLADFYNLAISYGILAPRESLPKARAAATNALEIDSSLAEAHAALASALTNDFQWTAAETEFRRALELNPGSARVHYYYSFLFLTPLARHVEAISEMQRARELDPLSLAINANFASTLWLARQPDQAIQQCLRTLEMAPHFSPAHFYLALAYQQNGMFEQAVTEMQKAITDTNEKATDARFVLQLARAYALAGNRIEAVRTMAKIDQLSKRAYVSPYDRATVFLALGQKDRALAELQYAYEQRDDGLRWLGIDPRFDEIHLDPRFKELRRRMNFPQ